MNRIKRLLAAVGLSLVAVLGVSALAAPLASADTAAAPASAPAEVAMYDLPVWTLISDCRFDPATAVEFGRMINEKGGTEIRLTANETDWLPMAAVLHPDPANPGQVCVSLTSGDPHAFTPPARDGLRFMRGEFQHDYPVIGLCLPNGLTEQQFFETYDPLVVTPQGHLVPLNPVADDDLPYDCFNASTVPDPRLPDPAFPGLPS